MNTRALFKWLRVFGLPGAILLLISPYLAAENGHTEIIPMQHRPANVLLEDLRPLLDGKVKLTASGNKLIARGPRGEITALKLLVEELDQPLAQFRISIRRGNEASQSRKGISYRHNSENIRLSPAPQTTTINRDGLTVTRITQSSSNRVVVHRNSSLKGSQSLQQVRATEGYPAYIEIGKKVPITQLLFHSVSHQPVIHQEYQPVVSGFYVTPRMANDRDVLLQLSTQKQSLKHNNQIDVQAYSGTVRGRLNEWIFVGGVSQRDSRSDGGISRWTTGGLSQQGAIYLKVEHLTR